MNALRILFGCGSAVVLAGCSSLGLFSGRGEADRQGSETAGTAEGEGVVLRPLHDASLPKGECGMILWTLDEERPVPVFRYLSGKTAQIVVNATPLALTRVEANGAASFGVAENQIFQGENGLKATVAVRFSLGFDGGSYLERGLITLENADGWRTVVPSAGLAGCRSK